MMFRGFALMLSITLTGLKYVGAVDMSWAVALSPAWGWFFAYTFCLSVNSIYKWLDRGGSLDALD